MTRPTADNPTQRPTTGHWPLATSPRPAFSIVEMLVVISIIGILAAITFPVVGALRQGSQFSSAENTIVASVNIVRAYTRRNRAADFQDINGVSGQFGDDSGVAIVFTPGGELRLVENDPDAANGSGNLIEIDRNEAGQSLRNAYSDIQGRDYVKLPSRVSVAGLRRLSSGSSWPDDVEFVPAPFAVRFDKHGTLINRQGGTSGTSIFTEDGHVYYDGDGNGEYETGSSLPAGYDPAEWDYRSANSSATLVSGSNVSITGNSPRWTLPTDRLDSLVVAVVYDVGDFTAIGGWNATEAEISNFMNENGRFIFFSRNTGLQRR